MNLFNIENAFKVAKERGWDKVYWAIDIHSTILEPDYTSVAKTYYPMAKEVLKKLTDRPDVELILFTCSYPNEIVDYLNFFKESDIHFDHVNDNKSVPNTRFGFFEKKFYCNVIIDDKGGFEPSDWFLIDDVLNKIELLPKTK